MLRYPRKTTEALLSDYQWPLVLSFQNWKYLRSNIGKHKNHPLCKLHISAFSLFFCKVSICHCKTGTRIKKQMKIFNYYHQADKKSGPPGMEIRLFMQRAESREQRAEGTGHRAESREQRAGSRGTLRPQPSALRPRLSALRSPP